MTVMDPDHGTGKRSGEPRIGLALGGGGARGFAHIHAIAALDELGLKPVSIAGSSIGALMGAGVASGMSGDDLSEYSLSVLGNRSEVFGRLWDLRPKGLSDFMKTGLRPGKIDLLPILEAFLPETLPAEFSGLKTPLKVTALDFFGERECVFAEGPLMPALAASAAIPAMFQPVLLNDRLYIDGGITNPVPFDHVENESDVVIAIDVVGGPSKPKDGSNTVPPTLDLLLGTSQLMMQSIIAAKLKSHRPHVFLQPAVNAWRVMDFLKAKQIIAETRPFRDDVKRAVEAALELHRLQDLPHDVEMRPTRDPG